MVPLLSVRVTNNTEKTFSMFSIDPSRSWLCLNIVPDRNSEPQTCQSGHVSPHHSPYIDMLHSLPWENWHGHLSLTDVPFAQFPPNKLFYSLKPPCKYYVPQVGVRLVKMAYYRVNNFPKSCLCSPYQHTSHDNIAHVQCQRTIQIWTCTPRLQLPSKLCLMRLGLTEEFLRTFSCPLLSLHLKWPLCIRYWCVVLICYRFC